jgi:hypothetical protein
VLTPSRLRPAVGPEWKRSPAEGERQLLAASFQLSAVSFCFPDAGLCLKTSGGSKNQFRITTYEADG